MIRVTIEMLPGGDAAKARVLSVIEMAQIDNRSDGTADYAVAAMKAAPFAAPLFQAVQRGRATLVVGGGIAFAAGADADMLTGFVKSHERARGVHVLLARALRALGLEDNP
jgi:hypothetical protein